LDTDTSTLVAGDETSFYAQDVLESQPVIDQCVEARQSPEVSNSFWYKLRMCLIPLPHPGKILSCNVKLKDGLYLGNDGRIHLAFSMVLLIVAAFMIWYLGYRLICNKMDKLHLEKPTPYKFLGLGCPAKKH